MLEKYVVDSGAALRLRSCLLGAHLDPLCRSWSEMGYPRDSIRQKVWIIGRLARWMTSKRLAVSDLDERRMAEFVDVQERRRSRRHRGIGATLVQLLRQLRDVGAVAAREVPRNESPGAALLLRYEEYLRNERALAISTIVGYRRFISGFIEEQLGAAAEPRSLQPTQIRDFLLSRIHQMAPQRMQTMGTALRSFLRFLFLRSETPSDLTPAVVTARRGHQVGVPRYLPAEDVERLLDAPHGSSASGRRDHAILLLLARLGLRAGEVMALQLDDLRWREGEIIVRGKGQIHDRLPLPNDAGQAIALYLRKDRPAGLCRHVFVSCKAPHRALSHPSSVTTIVTRALARAGLTPATRGAHLLRHSLATTMVRRGASFAEIGQVLRHRSAQSTEIYAKLDFNALRDVALPWPASGGAR